MVWDELATSVRRQKILFSSGFRVKHSELVNMLDLCWDFVFEVRDWYSFALDSVNTDFSNLQLPREEYSLTTKFLADIFDYFSSKKEQFQAKVIVNRMNYYNL